MGMMEELQVEITAKKPSIVYKAIQPTFTWDTAVGYLQHCADIQAGEPVGVMNYKLPVAEQIDSIRPIFEYLNENLKVEVIGADLYVTLTTLSDTIYCGNNDVLLWNVLGTSELTLDGDVRTVEQGDLVYIPSKVDYILKPNEARAYVLFSLQEN
jgi:hypothetical protein